MKRRRRRRTRLGSTAARFVEAKTEAMTPPRAGDSMPVMRRSATSAAAQEAMQLFAKVRSEINCSAAMGYFAEGQRQLGRLVELIESGGKGTLIRFKDELLRASDAARAAQRTIAGRCFCNRG
jgi:hypothetical protein